MSFSFPARKILTSSLRVERCQTVRFDFATASSCLTRPPAVSSTHIAIPDPDLRIRANRRALSSAGDP
ncbi:hypothetical protein DIJ63_27385 [Burkholderia pseudomallei]|nr:hypothetical protein DIJ63_27385 [Burkholderia pseudomallei]